MAWGLIIIGIILLIHGVIEKIREYRRKKRDFNNQRVDREFYRELESINNKLSSAVTDVSLKEKEFKQLIDELGDREKIIQSDNDFNSILKKEYRNLEVDLLSDKHKTILNLDKEGNSREEIAEQMDIGVREVDLVLKLYKRKADNNGR